MSGSRPLVSVALLMLGPHWESSWISCCCPGLAIQQLYVLLQIIDGMDVGAGQLITLVLGLGSYRVGPLAGSQHHQSALSSTALSSSPLAR